MDNDALNRLSSLDSVCDDLAESERQDRLKGAILCVCVDVKPNRKTIRQLDAGWRKLGSLKHKQDDVIAREGDSLCSNIDRDLIAPSIDS